jgi:bifunctional DNase/RNase
VELREVVVSDVRVAVPAGPGVEAGRVSLREVEEPHRSFDIIVGQHEARAIQSAWFGTVAPRPSTWDLLVSAVAVLRGRIDQAVIESVQEARHFFARLEIEHDGQRWPLEARPSDAIALVLRCKGARVLVSEEVLQEVGRAT